MVHSKMVSMLFVCPSNNVVVVVKNFNWGLTGAKTCTFWAQK